MLYIMNLAIYSAFCFISKLKFTRSHMLHLHYTSHKTSNYSLFNINMPTCLCPRVVNERKFLFYIMCVTKQFHQKMILRTLYNKVYIYNTLRKYHKSCRIGIFWANQKSSLKNKNTIRYIL